jgi:parallel beta-helix repeat protein
MSLHAACSKDESVTPKDENHAPGLAFTVTKLAVQKNTNFTLTVDATDPDGDALAVTWAVTRDGHPSGLLVSPQGNPSMVWATPATVGRDTITIEATDEKGGTTKRVETILVGTPRTSSIVGTNAVWEATESPFIVRPTGDNLVVENASLTIQAGCELYMDIVDRGFNIKGTLITDGTAQSPVVIRPNLRVPEAGFWPGITAEPEGATIPSVRLKHTNVFYATEAVKTTLQGRLFLDGCRIMFSSEAAVLFQSPDTLQVENSIITNNVKSGIKIIRLPGLPLPQFVQISNDSIAVNGDLSGATPYIDQAALYIDFIDQAGIVPITIDHNDISRNGFPGIQLVNASYPEIDHNAIYFNELGKSGTRYNIRLDNNFGGSIGSIDARDNYWGAAYTNPAVDSLFIKEGIRDIEDDASITVRLLIYPWLHARP